MATPDSLRKELKRIKDRVKRIRKPQTPLSDVLFLEKQRILAWCGIVATEMISADEKAERYKAWCQEQEEALTQEERDDWHAYREQYAYASRGARDGLLERLANSIRDADTPTTLNRSDTTEHE